MSLIAVSTEHRRHGVGRKLVQEAFAVAGGKRVDLLSDTAEQFYESFPHRRLPGFRIYPSEQIASE